MKAPQVRGPAQHETWPEVSGGRPSVGGGAGSGDPRTTVFRDGRSQFLPAERIAEIPRGPAGSQRV